MPRCQSALFSSTISSSSLIRGRGRAPRPRPVGRTPAVPPRASRVGLATIRCWRTSTSCPSSPRTTHCIAGPITIVVTTSPPAPRPPVARRGAACARAARPRSSVLLDEVGLADEVGHEAARRTVVDLARRAQLLDPARVHHGHPVGHHERLLLVVRHVDERDPDRLLDALELDLELLAHLQVERPERLVEQQHLGLHHERARERHALLLAARELARLALLDCSAAARARGPRVPAPRAAGLRRPTLLEAVGDVVEHVQVREQGVRLEDGVHVALVGRQTRHVLARRSGSRPRRAARSRRSDAASWSSRNRRARAARGTRRPAPTGRCCRRRPRRRSAS